MLMTRTVCSRTGKIKLNGLEAKAREENTAAKRSQQKAQKAQVSRLGRDEANDGESLMDSQHQLECDEQCSEVTVA